MLGKHEEGVIGGDFALGSGFGKAIELETNCGDAVGCGFGAGRGASRRIGTAADTKAGGGSHAAVSADWHGLTGDRVDLSGRSSREEYFDRRAEDATQFLSAAIVAERLAEDAVAGDLGCDS